MQIDVNLMLLSVVFGEEKSFIRLSYDCRNFSIITLLVCFFLSIGFCAFNFDVSLSEILSTILFSDHPLLTSSNSLMSL